MPRDPQLEAIQAALAAPFDARAVKLKPQTVKGNRALAVTYLDARLVQDRLDEVLGIAGWKDEYHLLPDGSVLCQLSLLLGGEWVEKQDVGSPSEQPDSGDRLKAAFSDALKRAAVKFGVGRYLYRLAPKWMDYDPAAKRIVRGRSARPADAELAALEGAADAGELAAIGERIRADLAAGRIDQARAAALRAAYEQRKRSLASDRRAADRPSPRLVEGA
jgi:hypothetical protein